MLTVKTFKAQSPIHGIGLFAAEFIPSGARVWLLNTKYDQLFAHFDSLPVALQDYAFDCGSGICLSADDDRFINHSDSANLRYEPCTAFAVRDIAVGEELTNDYREFGEEPPPAPSALGSVSIKRQSR